MDIFIHIPFSMGYKVFAPNVNVTFVEKPFNFVSHKMFRVECKHCVEVAALWALATMKYEIPTQKNKKKNKKQKKTFAKLIAYEISAFAVI